jgi:hypothetical protein
VLVTMQGFGSIWERRYAKNVSGARCFARTAFYNTTGVFVNGKMRPRWRIGGKVRFNAIGGFTPGNPTRSLYRVFECKEAELAAGGWTQILFKRMLNGPERPDFYLFVVTAESTGRIDIAPASWKAESVQVVALSEDGDQQQGMLLMPAYSWVRGALGTFYAEPSTKRSWSAELRLARS